MSVVYIVAGLVAVAEIVYTIRAVRKDEKEKRNKEMEMLLEELR